MKTVVSTKGQIIIPHELRVQDSIAPGDRFEVRKIKRGEYLLKKVAQPANAGLVDWLLSCPVKDFFQPIPSESTDEL